MNVFNSTMIDHRIGRFDLTDEWSGFRSILFMILLYMIFVCFNFEKDSQEKK